MIRKIIKINEDLCNGCGLCVNACHESAIALVDGKAKLLRDDYCDGLGNCLPVCPTNAISFEEREALEYNEEEVNRNIAIKKAAEEKQRAAQTGNASKTPAHPQGGCPGSRAMSLNRESAPLASAASAQAAAMPAEMPSMLRQWPVQIQLVPPNAPYFQGANLLIAADCTAYAFGNFHQFMKNKITLIGCPKLDDVDYSVKLTQILSANDIKSLTVIRMEVPCCGGIVQAVKTAMVNSEVMIPWRVITIGTDGTILEDN
ncbi:ferredoxin [Anaerotaenia torta]|uniref:ATP-binding protein n=1 Tax=Anaerotaenia torta TaxID=433293 RepID=UPI003D2527F2